MSLNTFRKENASDALLELLNVRYNRFPTVEEELNSQHELLRIEQAFKLKEENLIEPSIFKQLFINDFFAFGDYTFYCLNRNRQKFEYLQSSLNDFIAEKEVSELALLRRIKKAQAKIAYLNNFNNNYSWKTETSFLSTETIDTTQEGSLHINVNAGEATLPIENVESIPVKEIIIGDESNCIIGKPSGGNNKTYNLLEDNELKVFSAYKINDPNMGLNLNFRFQNEQIVNHLFVSLSNETINMAEGIEDVLFYNSNGELKSIKKLCNNTLKFNLSKNLECYFMPIETKNIILKFKQTKPYFLEEKPIYQIDLNSIRFNRVSFKSAGTLKSRTLGFGDANYLSVKKDVDIFPRENGFTSNTLIDLDNSVQKTFSSDDIPVLLSDYSNTISYTINLERNVTEENVVLEENEFFAFDFLIRPFNPRLIYSEEINQNFYKDKIKAAHILKGTIKGSKQSETVDLGFNKYDFEDESILLYYSRNGTMQGAVPFISLEDGLINNSDLDKIKIEHCRMVPKIISLYDYYYFEMGEFFELNSVSFVYRPENSEEERLLNYSVYLDEDKIKGVVISKQDLVFPSFGSKLSKLNNVSGNKFTTGKNIIKGSFKFLDNLGEGLIEKEYIDGVEEFKSLSEPTTEYLNSQNVSSSPLIVMELEEAAASDGKARLLKDGVFVSNITYGTDVNPSSLVVDEPIIDTNSNIFYLKTSEEIFFTGYSIDYQYLDSIAAAEKCFSIDYSSGIIAFSFGLSSDELDKRISFLYSDILYLKFDLAKYFQTSMLGNVLNVFDERAVTTMNLNLLRIYLGKVKQSINLKDNEKYFSPIISSFKLSAV